MTSSTGSSLGIIRYLGYKTFYGYDDAGRRTRQHIKLSTGGNDLYDVTYTYDKANRLTAVRDVLAGKTASYNYFDIGALKMVTLPNGITVHRTLDSRHRLDELNFNKTSTEELVSLDYTYDVKSNVTQLVRNDTGAGGTSKTFTFGYDGISRLTSANYGDETVSYTYDKAGNRLTQVSTVNGTTRYTIDTKSNQLTYRSLVPESTDFSTMNYTYDAEGKLTQRSEGGKSDAFTYGWGSKLKQVQKNRSGSPNQTIFYGYDGTGKRGKVTDSNGTRYFLYDGGMPVLELNAQKAITVSYLYGADGVVYRRIHSSNEYEYHHANALGSPVVLTDDSKNVLARYEYDVFGAIRNETGSSDNTRKFTGKEWDADVNLYYFSARYYDPYIGRFTQRDPAGDGGNWYIYGLNNPMKYVDPKGLRAVNDRERDVLTFTFGLEVGNFLASRINIEFTDNISRGGRVPNYTLDGKRNTNEIWLKPNYNENSLYWLGVFIHEATHIWQLQTNRHREGVGGQDYGYDANQLASRNLEIEEHAKAVQDWFVAVYGSKYNLLSDAIPLPRNHLTFDEVWDHTLGRLGFDNVDREVFDTRTKLSIINHAYAPVLQEIRQTGYLLTDQFR